MSGKSLSAFVGLLPVLMLACSSTKQPPPPIDHGIDAGGSEASTGPVASGCAYAYGASGDNGDGGFVLCQAAYACQSGQYQLDCSCPQGTCKCSAPNGSYRTVAYDCDAGCALPLSSTASACGLTP